jgi:hypothetical protein
VPGQVGDQGGRRKPAQLVELHLVVPVDRDLVRVAAARGTQPAQQRGRPAELLVLAADVREDVLDRPAGAVGGPRPVVLVEGRRQGVERA